MPSVCAVFGCANRKDRESDKKYFGFPGVRDRRGRDLPEGVKRRECWIKAIKRADLTAEKIKRAQVCSDHFLTGWPAPSDDSSNPDYAPSQKLGYVLSRTMKVEATSRHRRTKKRLLEVDIEEGSVVYIRETLQEEDIPLEVEHIERTTQHSNTVSSLRLEEQQEAQGVHFDGQEQDTSDLLLNIKEEITIDECVLEENFNILKLENEEDRLSEVQTWTSQQTVLPCDIKEEVTIDQCVLKDYRDIPKLENEEDRLLEMEIQTSQKIVSPSTSKEKSTLLHTSNKSRNKRKKISDDSRVEENCSILSHNLKDNIQISSGTSNKSSRKKRKVSDKDIKVEERHDFVNNIQVQSENDYVDYAMFIATRLKNANQSDHAMAIAKQKIELILCDLETGKFENFHNYSRNSFS